MSTPSAYKRNKKQILGGGSIINSLRVDSFAVIGRLNPFLARNRKKNRDLEHGLEQTEPMNRSKLGWGASLPGEGKATGPDGSPLRSARQLDGRRRRRRVMRQEKPQERAVVAAAATRRTGHAMGSSGVEAVMLGDAAATIKP